MRLRWISVLLLLVATSSAADTVFPASTSAGLTTLIGNGGGGVPDGGVIELAAGTYTPPADGFLILNPNRSFTIRAATAGTVFLDGAGSEKIFRFIINNATPGAVVFEGLTFRNGSSTQPAFGAAMTLEGAFATFIDCVFDSNANTSAGSGSGAVGIRGGSTALFLRSTWQDNTSLTSGAGAAIVTDSTMWCHECQFLRNRNNLPGHGLTATGGGFVVTSESSVYLSNSRFEDNEAGFAGGAFDVKGAFDETTPARVVAANSTFVGNLAQSDPGVVTNSPTAGGVANVEDNAVAQFYNSRLIDNTAQFGGAIGAYRAVVEVYDSVLRGNFATGRASTNSTPRGGAVFAISDDSAADPQNLPTVQVLIRDSLFHGLVSQAEGTQSAAAHTGGCVYTSGDIFRHVTQGQGTQAENSASLDIAGTAFVDCDVEDLIAIGPQGGGVFTELAVVTVDDSLFIDGDASAAQNPVSGGAIALNRFSDATLTDTTFAANSSDQRGGAIAALGSEMVVDNCTFFKNAVPGASASSSRGAGVYSGPQDGAGLGAGGVVRNSLFVENSGLAIFDDDRTDGTGFYNTVTYENNDFFETAFGSTIFRNTVEGLADVAGLNAMVVDRGGGNTTDKAPLNDNTELGTAPTVGALLAVPPGIIDTVAGGDPETATESFLAYAWCGDCAELDGAGLGSNTGLMETTTGAHGLMVFDNAGCTGTPDLDLVATVAQAPTPTATLSANPVMIMSGGTSQLTWGTPSGTFLESALDQDEGLQGTASGSVNVSPSLTTNYTFFTLTEEGGATAQEKVFVDEDPPTGEIFVDGFESGDTSAWDSTVGESP